MRQTAIDKIRYNEDHSLVAFTIDIGNNEVLTAGIKDMVKNEVLNFRLENVSQVEFFGKDKVDSNEALISDDNIYYVSVDQYNRPYKVNKMSLATKEVSTVFLDDDPTHYLDIKLSKDGKHLVIVSGTKEDSEVWCIDKNDPTPKLLIERQPNV